MPAWPAAFASTQAAAAVHSATHTRMPVQGAPVAGSPQRRARREVRQLRHPRRPAAQDSPPPGAGSA
eukprot:9312997-Alexandrium_andersonii.AAC.1